MRAHRLNPLVPFLALPPGLLCTALEAHADLGSSDLTLEVKCEDVERQSVERLLEIELRSGPEYSSPGGPQASLSVTCDARSVRIVAHSDTGHLRFTNVPLTEAKGEVGARLLVLKMVELLQEQEADVAKPEPADPVAPVVVARDPPEFHVFASYELLSFVPGAPFVGGDLSFRAVNLGPWYTEGALGLLAANRQLETGTVESRALSGTLELGLESRGQKHAGGLGVGLRGGHARISGSANEESRADGVIEGWWGGPILAAFVESHALPWLIARARAETGYAMLPVRGTVVGGPDIELAGPWISAQLGLGVVW